MRSLAVMFAFSLLRIGPERHVSGVHGLRVRPLPALHRDRHGLAAVVVRRRTGRGQGVVRGFAVTRYQFRDRPPSGTTSHVRYWLSSSGWTASMSALPQRTSR